MKKLEQMCRVKVEFNFAGIKHKARLDFFPVYEDKVKACIEFFQYNLDEAIRQYYKKK